jgi:hypothetical protein
MTAIEVLHAVEQAGGSVVLFRGSGTGISKCSTRTLESRSGRSGASVCWVRSRE